MASLYTRLKYLSEAASLYLSTVLCVSRCWASVSYIKPNCSLEVSHNSTLTFCLFAPGTSCSHSPAAIANSALTQHLGTPSLLKTLAPTAQNWHWVWSLFS